MLFDVCVRSGFLCISEVTQIRFLKRGVVKVEIYLIIADVLRSKVDTMVSPIFLEFSFFLVIVP